MKKLTEDILQLLDHLRMNLKRERAARINFIKLKNSLVHSIFLWTKRKLIFLVCHSLERTSLYKIYAMFFDKNMEHLILLKRLVTCSSMALIVTYHNLLGAVSK